MYIGPNFDAHWGGSSQTPQKLVLQPMDKGELAIWKKRSGKQWYSRQGKQNMERDRGMKT